MTLISKDHKEYLGKFLREMPNEEYHSLEGWFSSSQLKDALEDVEVFYKIYVKKEMAKNMPEKALRIGTYFHTAILEPHLLNKECVVWDGKRMGKAWIEFEEANDGKTILNATEQAEANNLIDAAQGNTKLMELLAGGEPELSAFAELMGVPIKVRADWIDLDKRFIMDLKSSTGNVKDSAKIKNTIERLGYDLSAALYLDAFNYVLKAQGKAPISDFYWGFASKDMSNSKVYKASPKMLDIGRRKYQKALKAIYDAKQSGWKFEDEVEEVSPLPWVDQLWMEQNGEGPSKQKYGQAMSVSQSADDDLL